MTLIERLKQEREDLEIESDHAFASLHQIIGAIDLIERLIINEEENESVEREFVSDVKKYEYELKELEAKKKFESEKEKKCTFQKGRTIC